LPLTARAVASRAVAAARAGNPTLAEIGGVTATMIGSQAIADRCGICRDALHQPKS
jgi:hypothetical protein